MAPRKASTNRLYKNKQRFYGSHLRFFVKFKRNKRFFFTAKLVIFLFRNLGVLRIVKNVTRTFIYIIKLFADYIAGRTLDQIDFFFKI